MKNILLGLIICCLSVADIKAQHFDFTNFGEYEGLKNSFVQCLAQDSSGYIWIGTNHGLYWYDGQYFDVFNYNATDSTSIAEDNITSLFVDSDKTNLWIGNDFGSISKFNTKSFKSVNYQRKNDEQYHKGMSAVHSLFRHKHFIFKGTRNKGLHILNLKTNEYTDVLLGGSSNYAVRDIKKIKSDLLLSTSKGIYKYNLSSIDQKGITNQELTHLISTENVSTCTVIDSSSILYHTNKRLILYNHVNKTKKVIVEELFNPAIITSHLIDEHKNIWLGTNTKGIYLLDLEGKILNHFISDGNSKSLVNDWTQAIISSKKQPLIWIGTKDGLSKLDYSEPRFKQFPVTIDKNDNTDNIFFLLKQTDNTYWYWSLRGLFYSKNGKTFKSINGFTQIRDGIEISDREILLCSNRGVITINTESFQTQQKSFRDSLYTDEAYDRVYSVLKKDKNLWFVTGGGIICYNKASHNKQIYPFPEAYKTNGFVSTSCIEFDNNGNIWIGERNGFLISLNLLTKKFNRYSSTLKVDQGKTLRHNLVLDIHTKNNEELWLGTYGAGLLQFNLKSKKISAVTSIETLNSNIYRIIKDSKGYYWMNTNNKIVRYDAKKNRTLSYGRLDGTLCREFNDGATFCDNNGNVLLGGFGGFVEFNPDEFNYNKTTPLTDINSYYINNEHDLKGSEVQYKLEYIPGDTLFLMSDQKQISFYCSVLNYISSEKNMASWKLEGIDEKWDTLYAYDYKVYNELPPGKYKLKAKGCNNDQIWNTKTDEILVIVKPAFKDSLIFKLLLITIPLLIFYLIYLARTRYLEHNQRRLEHSVQERTKQLQEVNSELEESKEEILTQKSELERHRHYLEDLVWDRTVDLEKAKEKAEASDRLKTAFLANLSHEIRTPMNSIVGFSTLLASDVYDSKERAEFASMVQKSSESLLMLIDDIIDISRIETGQVHLRFSDFCISELCQTVFKTLSFNTNKEKSVQYNINTNSVEGNCLIYSDPERLKQILINLLNNAIKFTKKGHVTLKVISQNDADSRYKNKLANQTLPQDYYLFIIEDTGMGIDKEHHEHIFSPFQKVQEGNDFHDGIGLGLSIVKQLINILGGKIWLESELDKGTTFYFFLPKQYKPDSK